MSARKECLLIAGVLFLSGCATVYYGTNPTVNDRQGTLGDGAILDERTGQPPSEWPTTVPAPAPPPRDASDS